MEFKENAIPSHPWCPGELAQLLAQTEVRAAASAGDFSIGIEEEYFLADAETLEAACETPDALFDAIKRQTGGQGEREFLQAQVEVRTTPHTCLTTLRAELQSLRQTVAAAAATHGLVILAAGTHPTARWDEIAPTPKDRYRTVMDALQMIGWRDMVCGMHVHVELPEPDLRVDVMSRMLPYVPLFLALSTSSPFWCSRRTGLKGYRLAAYDELPRTGLPEIFPTAADYEAYIAALVRSGVMNDSSYVWWTIRPSFKFPTLELRAPDCCTRLDDAIAIAALYRCLARHLYLHPLHNAGLSAVSRGIAVENKWRAQRYGVQGSFVTEDGAVSVGDLLDDLIELTADEADALGCTAEVEHCRAIVSSGTSADAQLKVFQAHEQRGADCAFKAVAEWLADTTLRG